MLLIACSIDPRKMVNPQHVHLDFISGRYIDLQILCGEVSEHVLYPQNLVTTSKDLQPRRDAGERPSADGHRVGVIDDPGVWAEFRQGFGKVSVYGNRPESAHEA